MKTAIFNFLVLQVVIWAFVFSSNDAAKSTDVNHSSISDTWEVAKIGSNEMSGVVLHYPSFNKLTLNHDGTYLRLKDDETLESGNWEINDEKTKLTLAHDSNLKTFEIIQLPSQSSESFIIREYQNNSVAGANIKYELTRI